MKNNDLVVLVKLFCLIGLLPVYLSGCVFLDLKKEIAESHDTYSIRGEIKTASAQYGNVIVILYADEGGTAEPVAYTIPEDTGYFSFLISTGTYYLLAFEDTNGNLTYDSDEAIGYYGAPDAITVSRKSRADADPNRFDGLQVHLAPETAVPAGAPVSIEARVLSRQAFTKLGRIATLDDDIFAQENGSLGYWKPLTFLRDLGYGIYFLEPYQPDKIPVLFIHGAVGTPVGWQPLISGMDRKRFQPWFYYYPSGVRLEVAAKALNHLVKELHAAYGFDTLYVTAHSMGGLVARAFILNNLHGDNSDYIKRFIALSTPWNGHKMSAKGVEQAPEAVPSWHDMVPDSPFIQTLYQQKLAPMVDFAMFISVRGDCSLFLANNDGSVEIASQLDYRAQADASHVFGFDEDHATILTSQRVIAHYNRILNADLTEATRKGLWPWKW